ncbi:MAG: ABC transporter permease subunit [Lachnospiraceae bacterium]|nr:ABC transporter permease subunit [Lachnospiraceae bacterium]
MKVKRILATIFAHLGLALLSVIWLIPILWLVVTAFSAYPGINISHFFPTEWSVRNFRTILLEPDSVVKYMTWFKNTLIIAIFTCIISTVFVFMVSYAFSCMRFKGRKNLMTFSLILNMFPGVLSMIAVYFILKSLGLTNSHLGMIIVYSAGSGLGYLIVKGYMDTIPVSLREAARLEGANELQTMTKVIMPICKPIIVYQVISSFLIPWGDFVLAKLMLNSGLSKDWTVAIGLYNMLDKSLINKYFSIFCAGGILISIPISILFVIMQKYYVEGVVGGATKG